MKTILGTMTFSDQVDQTCAHQMLQAVTHEGVEEVDTAYVYNKGETEVLLGKLSESGALHGLQIAGKANPWEHGGLTPESVRLQLDTSLKRLNAKSIDLFYLHAPDLNTPIVDTLQAVAELHGEGKFSRFGLSNYAAWQVAEIAELCKREGWPAPSVYQGMYNALTRDVERELFACLENYSMAFYVYNPLAGGMLSGKHQDISVIPDQGRFRKFKGYQERYWKPEYFEVINTLSTICKSFDVPTAEAALRWIVHHSALTSNWANHGLIVGASSMAHLEQNLKSLQAGNLPADIVAAVDQAWEVVRPACIKYFRP